MLMAQNKKEWIEVRATGPVGKAEEATALMVEAGSQGVIEELPFEPLPFDVVGPVVEDMTRRPETFTEPLTLIGYISSGDSLLSLGAGLDKFGWSITTSLFKDQAWTEKWKRFLRPVRAGGFMVRPVWSKAALKKGEHLIEIEPAMAFGTGGHETTRLCLRALKAAAKDMHSASSMLDIGTGSGILAIAGARLGFKVIVGTDIDGVALKNARKNLRINKTKARLTGKPLSELSGSFDLVVANIRTIVLYNLMEDIVAKVKTGGALILSGILVEEATDVATRFEAASLRESVPLSIVKITKSKEWVAITLR